MLSRLLALLCLLAVAASAELPPKATDYAGTVTAVTDTSITVKGQIGTRIFQVYPGTVFGKTNRQKLSDFKPGSQVIVVFSDVTGVVKAENIRHPDPVKPKPAPKPQP